MKDPQDVQALLARVRRGGREAAEAAAQLVSLGSESLSALRGILNGTDAEWKAAVLERVVAAFDKDVALELAPELLTLAMNATEADSEAEVDELAESILVRLL